MAKLSELQKYLDYEFSTGAYTGEDYKKFQNKYEELIKEKGDKCIFLCISDVRYFRNNWYNNILVRTAIHK